MLTRILLVAGLLFCLPGFTPVFARDPSLQGKLSFSGAWALYPLVIRWTGEFNRIYPGVQFDISAGGAGKGMTDVLTGAADAAMVSRDIHSVETARGAVAFPVARDAVVPVVNSGNPVLPYLVKHGVSCEMLARIWSGEQLTWGMVSRTRIKQPVRVYMRSDSCGATETWALFAGFPGKPLEGTGVYGDPGLAEAVRGDIAGIGYNNLNFAFDARTGKAVAGLAILPVDLNGNGMIDGAEAGIWETRDALAAAIAGGLYPSPPARDLYLVVRNAPSELFRVFLRWAMTDGRQFVEPAGFVNLSPEQAAKVVDSLK